MAAVVQYEAPSPWIPYDQAQLFQSLTDAKAAVLALTSMPFQRSWVDPLQEGQLKQEAAGTTRIAGAELSEPELDAACRTTESPETALTGSQRQARAAVVTYRWIGELARQPLIDDGLIRDIHSRIVTGCDDDHCRPGETRPRGFNVTFGLPLHRGCEGGAACSTALDALVHALSREFTAHDLLVQALAAHYHLAAVHPFEDGNGRTARALEAVLLQRAGLRDSAFLAMSNYYDENRTQYLASLATVRASGYDLTTFLNFGLAGIAQQCRRLSAELKRETQKALVRNTALQFFGRLWGRQRVVGGRQIQLLDLMLEIEEGHWHEVWRKSERVYKGMRSGQKAFFRDIDTLLTLGALGLQHSDERTSIRARLEWPTEIREAEFFKALEHLPRGKARHAFKGNR